MPPDHDPFSGSVHLDDAGSVMRGIVWPVPAGLRRIPDRETGDQADWIFVQLRRFPQQRWLVLARLQPRPLAGPTVDPGTVPGYALVPYRPAGQPRGITRIGGEADIGWMSSCCRWCWPRTRWSGTVS
jgi:hypothetical protein